MTNRKILKKLKNTKKIILKENLYNAIIELKNLYASIEHKPPQREFNNIESTFNYMLEYFGKDTPDPQREKIYKQLQKDLLNITDNFEEYIKSYQTTDYRNIYSYYHQKVDLLDLINKFDNNYEKLEDIFKRIWLKNKFETNLKIGFNQIFESKEIKTDYKAAFVSAITLSLIRFFDTNKFEILFETYQKCSPEISLRGLVGLILGLLFHQKRIKLYPQISSRFSLMNEVPNNTKNIELVLFQLIRSKETEDIIREFEQEIMPEMMKFQDDIKKLDFDDLASDNMMDDENPGWENFFDKNPEFLERMENFTKRQFDGSDIFSATLGNLKNFSFFQKISNWFLPFKSDNIEIRQKLSNSLDEKTAEKFLQSFEKASYFCNSDKFSFCLHIPDISPQMRNTAVNMLINEIEAAEEMIKDEKITNDFKVNKDIITRYIQDLYRFYNFNSNFKGYPNIFKLDLSIHNSEILNYFDNKEHILRSTAELFFSKKFFVEAAQAFEKAVNFGLNEADVYEKLAFSYQKIKKFDKALNYYKKAELFDRNKKWLFKKIGFTSLKTSNFQQALDYYKKAETEDPEDIAIQTFIGKCFLAKEDYEQALKYYFKADFYKPNNVKTMRSIAFASLKLGKFEQATKYALKCIDKKGAKFDFFLLGNINWINNNKKEAILYYKTAMSEFDSFDKFRDDFLIDKKFLMDKNISETDISLMIDYLEMIFYKKQA